jgi:hypothetical protein
VPVSFAPIVIHDHVIVFHTTLGDGIVGVAVRTPLYVINCENVSLIYTFDLASPEL